MTSYKELVVWQKAMTIAEKIYLLTSNFPPEEKFGLVSQIRRSAVSIPLNIAEGRGRSSRKDFAQFLHIALGSVNELETQLELSMRLSLSSKADYNEIIGLLLEVKKMLFKMISSLKAKS
ncbi:four helix bundle protein [Candidatus Kaiserbacteria bacterium]|nr:four helix bundle protein [Candidatus Kaiserbacteria bacterium]